MKIPNPINSTIVYIVLWNLLNIYIRTLEMTSSEKVVHSDHQCIFPRNLYCIGINYCPIYARWLSTIGLAVASFFDMLMIWHVKNYIDNRDDLVNPKGLQQGLSKVLNASWMRPLNVIITFIYGYDYDWEHPRPWYWWQRSLRKRCRRHDNSSDRSLIQDVSKPHDDSVTTSRPDALFGA